MEVITVFSNVCLFFPVLILFHPTVITAGQIYFMQLSVDLPVNLSLHLSVQKGAKNHLLPALLH